MNWLIVCCFRSSQKMVAHMKTSSLPVILRLQPSVWPSSMEGTPAATREVFCKVTYFVQKWLNNPFSTHLSACPQSFVRLYVNVNFSHFHLLLKYHWADFKGNLFCSNEGSRSFPRGDNNVNVNKHNRRLWISREFTWTLQSTTCVIAKIHWRNLRTEPQGQF